MTADDRSGGDGEIHLSIVAPAYNEEDNVRPLVEEILPVARTIGRPFEIVIANDASTDRTGAVLDELLTEVAELRVIDLQPNAGQTAGLEACFRAARGQYVATVDADLQNDPSEIPRMLELITSGQCDMVNGWRKDRQDPPMRLICTRIGNRLRDWLTHENIKDSGCGLKVYRREVVRSFKLFNGLHRYFPTLAKMNGFRVIEIPVKHRPRTAGVAKYGLWNRLFKVYRDAIAIRWMQKRNLRYASSERRAPAPADD
jgi:glycosyltransferase involved in cell wall biosynthesis